MKTLKHLVSSILILILISSVFQCGSTQKLEKNAPTEFLDIYYQRWNAGIKEGGSGVNVFYQNSGYICGFG